MVSTNILIGAGIVVVVVVVLALATTGFVPVISDLIGASNPRDLGVRYSDTDYQSGLAKIPGHTITNPEDVCITCTYISRGSVPVDATFTDEEFTAQMNKLNSKKGPLRNIQVKFNADGSVETSAKIIDPKLTAPVYAKGKIKSYADKSVYFEIEKLELGKIEIGEKDKAEEIAGDMTSHFFSQNPGLSIENLEVADGTVKFKGTFPQEIIGDPASVPQEIIQ